MRWGLLLIVTVVFYLAAGSIDPTWVSNDAQGLIPGSGFHGSTGPGFSTDQVPELEKPPAGKVGISHVLERQPLYFRENQGQSPDAVALRDANGKHPGKEAERAGQLRPTV